MQKTIMMMMIIIIIIVIINNDDSIIKSVKTAAKTLPQPTAANNQ